MCGVRIIVSFKRHSVEEVIVANPESKMCEKANQSYCVRVMVEMSILLPFIPCISHPYCSFRILNKYYLNYIGTRPTELSAATT